MATPSSKYDVKGQVNLNTAALPVMVNSAGTWKTLYPEANLEFDSSILYTKPAVKTMANMTVPFVGTSDPRYSISEPIGSLYNRTGINVTIYKHKQTAFPTLQTGLGYTLGLNVGRASNNGYYFWGKDETKDGTLGTNYDTAIIRDWKYNEIIIRPRIYGYTVETIQQIENNEEFNATPIEIQLDELIEHPENYYVSDIRYMSALVWDAATNDWISLAEGFNVFAVYDNNYITGMESTVNQQVSHFLMTKDFSNTSPTRWNASTTNTSTYKEVIGNLISNTAPRQLSTTYVYGMGYPDTDFELTPNIDIISTKVASAPILSTTSTVRTGSVNTYGVLYDNIQSRCWYKEEVAYDSLNSQNYFSKLTYQFFYLLKGTFVSQIIASFGLYTAPFSGFNPNVDNDQTKPKLTPTTLGLGRKLWLGEMNSKGFTSGNWIPMEDLEKYTGYNIDGDSANPGFDPEGGGGGGDDGDDPWDKIAFGPGGGNLGVFAKFYLCTATDLANLRSWFSGGGHQQIPEGFDPMTQIIGLSQFATSVSGTAVDEAEITFRAADNTPVYTGVFCQRGSGADLSFDLGSIDIPLRMKDRGVPFLDYSSTVELYVPFCGTFQLDPQTVLGRTVAVRMWMSTTTGECFAIATADGAPVAYGSGNMSAEMPISSGGWGMYKAQLATVNTKVVQAGVSAFSSGLEAGFSTAGAMNGKLATTANVAAGAMIGTAIGGPVGTIVGGVVSAAPAIADAINSGVNIGTQKQQLKNSSSTAISGSLSSTAAWHQPFTPYIKITRPHYKKPDNYAHTQAIPLVATRTLSECAGLTMCVGTDLSSLSATEIEKEAIQSFLSNGIIV